MEFLYGIGIRLYGLLIRLASLWHSKARQWVVGRRDWAVALEASMRPLRGKRVVWFHCASLGEFEQGRRVMERFMELHPDWRLVVSFFSPSGYEVRKGYELASAVCYLPLDTRRNAERFVGLVSPDAVFFVKYEFWFHVLAELSRRRVPTFLISALFREDQAFFGPFGRWYRRSLSLFTLLFVQTEQAVRLLSRFGIAHVICSGDTRFDRVHDAVGRMRPLKWLESFAGGNRLFVMGSTWPKDEEIGLRVAQQLPSGWKLVLVPHEIDAQRIGAWCRSVPLSCSCYSEGVDISARVLVVDMVGLLLSVYASASMAYVGGGFGVGIHNTLEPAAYGIPVLFGPNHSAFREALGLLEAGGAMAVGSVEEGVEWCMRLMSSEELCTVMGASARGYVESQVGATDIILGKVEQYL